MLQKKTYSVGFWRLGERSRKLDYIEEVPALLWTSSFFIFIFIFVRVVLTHFLFLFSSTMDINDGPNETKIHSVDLQVILFGHSCREEGFTKLARNFWVLRDLAEPIVVSSKQRSYSLLRSQFKRGWTHCCWDVVEETPDRSEDGMKDQPKVLWRESVGHYWICGSISHWKDE